MLEKIKGVILGMLILPECFVKGIEWGWNNEGRTDEEIKEEATKYARFAYRRMKRRLHWQ